VAGSLRAELPLAELVTQMAEQARALTQAEHAALELFPTQGSQVTLPAAPDLPAWHIKLPLRLGSEVLGQLVLERSPSAAPFTREDASRLAAFAAQVAPLVGYAREAQWTEGERLFLDAVLQNAPDGIVFVDTRGEVSGTRSNAAAERILGQAVVDAPLGELPARFGLHHPSGALLAPEELPQRRALRGEIVLNQEIVVHRPDGKEIVIRANAAPVRAQSGARLGAVCVFQDVTAFRELARLRDELSALVTHDLKTPLHAMQLRLERLERMTERAEGTERVLLGQLRATSERVIRLVSDLSDASSLETGQLNLRVESLSLERSVQSLLEQLEPVLGERVVALRVEPGVPAVRVDPLRLEQIVTNLITNGVKHSQAGTPVELTLAPEGEGASLSVRDRGEGIAPDELPHIFDRFYQGSHARESRDGQGLGLFITRKLGEAHGGRIAVESAPGEGSTFKVWLPAPRPGAQLDPPSADR
jgi:PAS domain S-box-containing protein